MRLEDNFLMRMFESDKLSRIWHPVIFTCSLGSIARYQFGERCGWVGCPGVDPEMKKISTIRILLGA